MTGVAWCDDFTMIHFRHRLPRRDGMARFTPVRCRQMLRGFQAKVAIVTGSENLRMIDRCAQPRGRVVADVAFV